MAARFRLRAPELVEGDWLNTGGQRLSLEDLRGKIVILDFWTFCCINCLHVLDELRELEEQFDDVLVVVGVHSPKFAHEAELSAVEAAVRRYEVSHPVLNDPQMHTWQQYAVRAWPTLAVIDPEGFIVAQHSGEGHGHALAALLEELVAEHSAKGTLRRGDSPYVPPLPPESAFSFPAKVIAAAGGFAVADAGNHRVVFVGEDLSEPVRVMGTGTRGLVDGDDPQFSEPNGLCLLPSEVAAAVGYDLIVADTVNHVLRGVDTRTGRTQTIAGTGRQWMQGDGMGGDSGAALDTSLSSPWDVVWWPALGEVVIAMAGIHQLWSFDPRSKTVRALAGTTNEGLVDGVADQAWFAQTSGLAVDGEQLWFVDSETSSLRSLSAAGMVTTHIGTGLFDFGYVDGAASEARLQHPLGLCVLPDGSIAIADTYNSAVRRYDPQTREVTTMARGLAEPSGLLVDGETLIVVEANAGRLVRLPLSSEVTRHAGQALRTQRPATTLRPGTLALSVVFSPPAGQKLDDRYGPSTQLVVSASPPELLASGAGTFQDLSAQLEIADLRDRGISHGVLHVSARAASCDDTGVEFPACHVHQQDWGVPVVLDEAGQEKLNLLLAGLAEE